MEFAGHQYEVRTKRTISGRNGSLTIAELQMGAKRHLWNATLVWVRKKGENDRLSIGGIRGRRRDIEQLLGRVY
ncbi:unnamed protein product [Linum trigynum]|uniref:Transposase n=1 Tax=Linum trigynum TaxID=586398 RepID=A0AAV2GNN4_9ROSI